MWEGSVPSQWANAIRKYSYVHNQKSNWQNLTQRSKSFYLLSLCNTFISSCCCWLCFNTCCRMWFYSWYVFCYKMLCQKRRNAIAHSLILYIHIYICSIHRQIMKYLEFGTSCFCMIKMKSHKQLFSWIFMFHRWQAFTCVPWSDAMFCCRLVWLIG